MSTEPENLVLVMMRNLERKMDLLQEGHDLFAKRQARLIDEVGQLHSEISQLSAGVHQLRGDINSLRSDVVLLENHNLSRHTENMAIMRRLERIGNAAAPGADNGAPIDIRG